MLHWGYRGASVEFAERVGGTFWFFLKKWGMYRVFYRLECHVSVCVASFGGHHELLVGKGRGYEAIQREQ